MGEVIRVGDTVKIITPERFIRCGYPFDQVKATDDLMTYYRDEIDALIEKVDPNPKYRNYIPEGDYRALCGRIARIVAQRQGFGGKERTLHTERDETLTGLRCEVRARKVHKTGTYFPATGGRSYSVDYGYDDYFEPGGLSDEKTHVILTLQPLWHYDDYGCATNYNPDVVTPIMIERIHVEKEQP
jgi:hypothetical protein